MPTPISATPINPSEDSYIREGAPTTNYGGSTTLRIGLMTGKAADDRRAILEFDLSSYLTTKSHELMTLGELVVHGGSVPLGMGTVYLRKLTQDFDPASVTWNEYEAGNSWATGGGDHDGSTDTVVAAASGEIRLNITDYIRDAMKNEGGILRLIIMGVDTPLSQDWFISSLNHATASERPTIEIEYLEGGRRRKGNSRV